MAVKAEKKEKVNIIVGDPEVLRPVELPLVVKLEDGQDWANEAQAEYAKTLNGYAYKNPTKWAKKKDELIARLTEIGEDPSKLNLYKGIEENLTYGNKLTK